MNITVTLRHLLHVDRNLLKICNIKSRNVAVCLSANDTLALHFTAYWALNLSTRSYNCWKIYSITIRPGLPHVEATLGLEDHKTNLHVEPYSFIELASYKLSPIDYVFDIQIPINKERTTNILNYYVVRYKATLMGRLRESCCNAVDCLRCKESRCNTKVLLFFAVSCN